VFDKAFQEKDKFEDEKAVANVDKFHGDFNDSMQHIETIESVDSNELSPRSKQVYKVTKQVADYFKEHGECPSTKIDFYKIGKCIGRGAFGKVNLAVHKVTQSLVAIKSINKQYLNDESSRKKVMQEVYILKKIRHCNVVHFFETFETDKYILLVMELCGGGDLLNYVRKRRRLKEDLAKYFFKQIIEALHYIHQKNIVHRDIKLDNILLDSDGNVKVCDFGVSKLVKPGETMSEQCGTPAYIAPEILLDRGYKGFGVDVWSAGVVLYSMLYGTVPFKGNSMSELHNLIIRGNVTFKDDISQSAISLLKGLLEIDPNRRLSTDQILKHEWLNDINYDLSIFTETEKDIIRTEYTYNDTRRLNRNMKNESTVFTEHQLDSVHNSLDINQTTKSVILAPFNSTRSHLSELHDSFREQMYKKGEMLKLQAKVRDIDRQYEFNNNCELDNGVYNRFVNENEDEKEEEKSVRLGEDGEAGAENHNLQELEGMIEQQNNEDKTHGRSTSHVRSLSTIYTELDKEIIRKVFAFGYPKEFIVN
jgi:serine/threonine protein kinase